MKILAALLLILGTSCATVIHGRYQSVPVTSSPAGARIAVDCGGDTSDAGLTPAKVTLPRKAETCSLTLSKDGYEPRRVSFERVPSKARYANILPGVYLGVIGAVIGFYASWDNRVDPVLTTAGGAYLGWRAPHAIDEATGAAWKQVPEEVAVTLPAASSR